MDPRIIEMDNRRPQNLVRTLITVAIVLGLIIWSWDVFYFEGFVPNGDQIALNILAAFIEPTQEFLNDFEVDSVWFLMLETIGIGFFGTLLGALLSFPFAILSARNIVGEVPSLIGNAIVTFIRTFPMFIWAMMFLRVIGPGPVAGVFTIAVLSIGMLSKMFIEAIEDIDTGILQAMDAAGNTTFQKLRFGVIPQLTANFLSIILHRFEINVKNATVLGLVGAGGIGFSLISAMNAYRWQDTAAYLWGIIIVVLLIEAFSNRVREKIVTGE